MALALALAATAGLAVAVQDEFEPNDTRQEAAEIDAGTYDGLEVPSDGFDYYAVELEEGQEITTTIRFTHADGDLELLLYPPGEDSRFVREKTSTTDDEQFTYTATDNGTHYVLVYGYDYHGNTYSMEVDTGPAPGDETDGGSGDGTDGQSSGADATSGQSGSSDDGSEEEDGGGNDQMVLLALGGVAVAGLGYFVYRDG